MTKAYTVNLWGSKPFENDDCWTGTDFDTIEEARACFADPWATFDRSFHVRDTAWIELDGPDFHEERQSPDYRPRRGRDDGEWQSEHAMQAGMAFGCDGYNDAMA